MKWREVTRTETTGTASHYANEIPRSIFFCTLACGHVAQVTALAPPLKLDCMACDNQPWSQPALPMALPRQVGRMVGWGTACIVKRRYKGVVI